MISQTLIYKYSDADEIKLVVSRCHDIQTSQLKLTCSTIALFVNPLVTEIRGQIFSTTLIYLPHCYFFSTIITTGDLLMCYNCYHN